MKRFSKWPILLALSLSLIACGGGSTGGESGDTGSGLDQNPGFNPEPEDVFDLPNTLPDSFLTQACPNPDGTAVFDLDLKIFAADRDGDGQPDARLHDYDGDGDMDSILLVQDDPDPKTLIFEGSSHTDMALPPEVIEFMFSSVIGGYEFDNNLSCRANSEGDLEQTFGFSLIPGAWQFTPYVDPVFEQWFFPVPPPPDPNLPPYIQPIYCSGFEGAPNSCGLPIPPFAGLLRDKPGIHVVATRILEIPDQVHCVSQVWRILICPVACHCEADGTPIPFSRQCIRERIPSDSPCN